MDSINDVAASVSLGGASAKQSAENQSGGTLNQTTLAPLSEMAHGTTTFSQSVQALSASISAQKDETYSDGGNSGEASLGEFLKRPVQLDLGGALKALIWTVGAGSVGDGVHDFDPWTMWQQNAKVKQKLDNFAYLKGELKVRFVIAGTPFHYGRLLVSYLPFGTDNTVFTQYLTNAYVYTEGPTMYLSTCLSGELDPMSCAPLELTLPFVHYKNWMDVSATETLGKIYMRILAKLTKASDTAVDTIAITAFAWLENAELCVPTLAYPTSSKEQPGDASISSMATAVASSAGALSKVPVIGKFAKATSIASTAVGDVAKMLGLSRPVDIEKPTQAVFASAGSMALTQGASLAKKITLDPRQELTIDPRTAGLPPKDETTFESIVNRECWLTTVAWTDSGGPFTTSGASDPSVISALLFVANVTPNLCKRLDTIVGTNATCIAIQRTPSMFVARAFNFWRGTMVFRFRVIASSFHRGNLRITYDPISPWQAVDMNSQMTHIIDLSEARELVIRVPWCSQYPYLEVASQKYEPKELYSPNNWNGVTNFAYTNFDKTMHNGVIMASIVNQLVAPNGQPAYLMVSSWMENCEFQMPSKRVLTDYVFMAKPTSGVQIVSGKQSDGMSQICFGERITDIKALMKRSSLCTVNVPGNTTSAANQYLTWVRYPQFPLYGEADSSSNNRSEKNSFITYFSPAFVVRRGSLRYRLVWSTYMANFNMSVSNIANCNVSYSRSWDSISPGLAASTNLGYTFDQTDTNVIVGSRDGIVEKSTIGHEGSYIANFTTQDRIHEIEIPDYNGNRFNLAQFCPVTTAVGTRSAWWVTKNPGETGFQSWSGKMVIYENVSFTPIIYVSSGEDYTLMWFTAAPPIYVVVGS